MRNRILTTLLLAGASTALAWLLHLTSPLHLGALHVRTYPPFNCHHVILGNDIHDLASQAGHFHVAALPEVDDRLIAANGLRSAFHDGVLGVQRSQPIPISIERRVEGITYDLRCVQLT